MRVLRRILRGHVNPGPSHRCRSGQQVRCPNRFVARPRCWRNPSPRLSLDCLFRVGLWRSFDLGHRGLPGSDPLDDLALEGMETQTRASPESGFRNKGAAAQLSTDRPRQLHAVSLVCQGINLTSLSGAHRPISRFQLARFCVKSVKPWNVSHQSCRLAPP